jgi:hypothetical protein
MNVAEHGDIVRERAPLYDGGVDEERGAAWPKPGCDFLRGHHRDAGEENREKVEEGSGNASRHLMREDAPVLALLEVIRLRELGEDADIGLCVMRFEVVMHEEDLLVADEIVVGDDELQVYASLVAVKMVRSRIAVYCCVIPEKCLKE